MKKMPSYKGCTTKTWKQLTPEQKKEAEEKLKFAGFKDPKEYPSFPYFVKDSDGTIYGWSEGFRFNIKLP